VKRKTSSTIPFGYKEVEDNTGYIEEIPGQLEVLDKAKQHILTGALSLRGAAEQIEFETGRSISAVGLKKIVDKERKNSLLAKQI
tara:strand:+ start:1439 stop:1693 length:255 start_codon:yes stop_codon:yes gene_type:complete